MRGKATTAGDSVVEFDLPNNDQVPRRQGRQHDRPHDRLRQPGAPHERHHRRQDPHPPRPRGAAPLPAHRRRHLRRRGAGAPRRARSSAAAAAASAARAAAPPRPGWPRPASPADGAPMGMAPGADRPARAARWAPEPLARGGRHRPPVPRLRAASSPGAAGVFTVTPGLEMRVGRDGATCQILLTEPRVSGTHATLKFEAGSSWSATRARTTAPT